MEHQLVSRLGSPGINGSGELDISETVQAALTPELETLLGQFIDILISEAHRRHLPVTDTTVDDYFDPELGLPVIIVTQYATVPLETALEHRDQVSLAIAKWRASLAKEQKKIASRQLIFEVRWT